MTSLASVVQSIIAQNRIQKARPYIQRAVNTLRERLGETSRFGSDSRADTPSNREMESGKAPPSRAGATDNKASPPLPGDGSYEVVLSIMGTLLEKAPRAKPVSGVVQFIQGSVSNNPADGYYAFISVQDINVPLVAHQVSRSLGPFSFEINIPGKCFELVLDNRTEPNLIKGVEDILKWFTRFNGSIGPQGNQDETEHVSGTTLGGPHSSFDGVTAAAMNATAEVTPSESPEKQSAAKKTQSAIDRAGTKGAELITKYGDKINASIKTRADETVAKNADQAPKEVKLGGSATATVLGGAKKVAGAGAGVAAAAIDRVSTVVGNSIANNRVTVSMREAPENTMKRQVHDLLVAGAMAIGRVYIAADDQGKLIIENLGDSAGRVAGTKYGSEAEQAARAMGHIGLDTYRIMRFPQKLGVTTLIKSAMKGASLSRAYLDSEFVAPGSSVGGTAPTAPPNEEENYPSASDTKYVELGSNKLS